MRRVATCFLVVAHDGSKEFDLTFPADGTYHVSASVAVQNATRDWELRTENPDSAATVVVTSDGELRVGVVAI